MPFLGLSNSGLNYQLISTPASTPIDAIVAFAVVAFAQGKFYLLFSFLFGYGVTLILRSAAVPGRGPYLRRLLGLGVYGFLHAVLFFIGDILMSYAVLGLVLLLFVRRSTRTVVIAAAVSMGIGVAALTLIVLAAVSSPGSTGGIVTDPATLDTALATGSFLDAAAARFTFLPEALIFQVAFNWFPALSMLLLGLAAARTSVLSEPAAHARLWSRLLIVSTSIGLPLGLFSAWLVVVSEDPTGIHLVLGVAVGFASAPLLTAGYVALFARGAGGRAGAWFEPAGRMSLTGYLGESIVLSAVFCGWGLGLFGQLGIAVSAGIALLAWLGLDLFAGFWLRHFNYGPFEFFLRWWSRLRRPVMRRWPENS
jgi:uncharacterized protein